MNENTLNITITRKTGCAAKRTKYLKTESYERINNDQWITTTDLLLLIKTKYLKLSHEGIFHRMSVDSGVFTGQKTVL